MQFYGTTIIPVLLPQDKTGRLLLAGFMVGTALLVVVANWSGIGWSWDSTDYVSAGRAISHGLGPLDVTAKPMTVRTPGYPALIAIGEWLNLPTNFTLVAINAVCASIVTTCTFIVLHRHTRKVAAIIATSFVLLNPSLLWQYSMAWSEPPFIAALMLTIVVSLYMQHPAKYAILAGLFTALFFMRYVGPVFSAPIAAVGVLADARVRGWFKSLIGNAAALLASFIPMWWWLARNQRIDGTFTGARQPGGGTFLEALLNGFGTIGTFFSGQPFDSISYQNWSNYPIAAQIAFVVLFLVAIGLLATIFKQLSINIFRSPTAIAAAMPAFVVFTYLVFSAYRFVHWELGRLDTRMMVPLLAPIVVVVAIAVDYATKNNERVSIASLAIAFSVVFANTAIFAIDTASFAADSRHSSTTENQNVPLYAFVRELPASSGLFSNAPQQLAPFVDNWPIFTQFQMDTPRPVECTHRYAVWFKAFSVQDNIPNMTPVLYEDATGVVYDLGLCSADINEIWD
jgi:hypothetical protein